LKIHALICRLALGAMLTGPVRAQAVVKPAATPKKTSVNVRSRAVAPRAAQSDAELEKAIRERFAASKISVDKFEVHVQGGRATLTGNTNVLQHKGTATRLARNVGASDVVNKIEPTEEARQKAASNLTKGRRRAQIKRTETTPRSEKR